MISTDAQHVAEVTAATAAFASKVTDPKAAVQIPYNFPSASTFLNQLHNAHVYSLSYSPRIFYCFSMTVLARLLGFLMIF